MLKKSKVAEKGVEAALVTTVIITLANLLDIEVDEKIISGGVVAAIALYYSIKNWWKHR